MSQCKPIWTSVSKENSIILYSSKKSAFTLFTQFLEHWTWTFYFVHTHLADSSFPSHSFSAQSEWLVCYFFSACQAIEIRDTKYPKIIHKNIRILCVFPYCFKRSLCSKGYEFYSNERHSYKLITFVMEQMPEWNNNWKL